MHRTLVIINHTFLSASAALGARLFIIRYSGQCQSAKPWISEAGKNALCALFYGYIRRQTFFGGETLKFLRQVAREANNRARRLLMIAFS